MSLQWTGRRISGIDGRVRVSLNDISGEKLLEAEPVAGGVEDPGVVVGALHAGVQPQRLPGQLPCGQGAGVGQRAEWLTLDIAFLLPLGKVTKSIQISRLCHPLNGLVPGDKVDVVVLLHSLLDPLCEHLRESLVNFEPRSVKTQTQRSSIGLVVAVKVMAKKSRELFFIVDV